MHVIKTYLKLLIILIITISYSIFLPRLELRASAVNLNNALVGVDLIVQDINNALAQDPPRRCQYEINIARHRLTNVQGSLNEVNLQLQEEFRILGEARDINQIDQAEFEDELLTLDAFLDNLELCVNLFREFKNRIDEAQAVFMQDVYPIRAAPAA